MRMTRAHWFSLFLAVIAGFAPIVAIALPGFDVPTASQAQFDSAAPPLRQGETWSQTFYFPDRPVTGVALRPGTYGRRQSGRITARIGPVFYAAAPTIQAPSVREFIIDTESLQDNRWHSFSFASLPAMDGAAGVLRLTGMVLPDEDSFTLWRNTRENFPDGVFAMDGRRQSGDICFKILSRVSGPDAVRMLKGRWQAGKPKRWTHVMWPLLPALLWPLGMAAGLIAVLCCKKEPV